VAIAGLRTAAASRRGHKPRNIPDNGAAIQADAIEGRLAAVDKTLQCIDSGSYGRCVMCGSQTAEEGAKPYLQRLSAGVVPFADSLPRARVRTTSIAAQTAPQDGRRYPSCWRDGRSRDMSGCASRSSLSASLRFTLESAVR
jgi:hypothetical protein